MEKSIANQEPSTNNPKLAVWDCGSSLYDSFELKSLEKQLDAAIASRTVTMPHSSDHRRFPSNKKTYSRISRSLNRLLRSVFGNKSSRGDFRQHRTGEEFYVVYDRSGALSSIPEVPEFDGLSPEIRSLVRRTASERFTDVGSPEIRSLGRRTASERFSDVCSIGVY